MIIGPVHDGRTALAGGGQANAPQLSEGINRFTTVATAADSCRLPGSDGSDGMAIAVINSGAASMNVFPDTGESINALAANTAFAIAAGGRAIFLCMGGAANRWFAILSA